MIRLYVGLFLVLGLQYCSPKTIAYSGEVTLQSKEPSGTVILNASGYGRNYEAAVHDAKVNAFQVLLFKGIPGSELRFPLVDDEVVSKERHKEYYENLLDKESYRRFIIRSDENPMSLVKVKGSKKIVVHMTIDYISLRKDLEQKQIIRKFGY